MGKVKPMGSSAAAVGCFVVFGILALAMGRSAVRDLRQGRDERDGVSVLSGLEQLWPAGLAAIVAIAVPVIILSA